jgi:hypothetical protein
MPHSDISQSQTEGRTSLYDAILTVVAGLLEPILKVKLLQEVASDSTTRRFLVVVLSGSPDVTSKHSIVDTREALAKINRELGSLKLLKILFIGVRLDTQAETAIKSLSDAAGEDGTYERVESTQAIKAKFHELSIGLQVSGDKASDQKPKVDWNGLDALLRFPRDRRA